MRDGGEGKWTKGIVGRKEVVVRVRADRNTTDINENVFGKHNTMDNNW